MGKLGQKDHYFKVMRAVRGQMPSVFVFSFLTNLLLLTLPVYMLQVYDRVLSSGSVDTLIWLSVIAAGALLVYGLLEQVRKRILTRVGSWIDKELSPDVISRGIQGRISGSNNPAGVEDVMDIRSFYAGDAVVAFLDAPWTPAFIALIWFLHPWLGVIAVAGAIFIFLVAILNDWLTRRKQAGLNEQSRRNGMEANHYLDSAETLSPLGMSGAVIERWRQRREPLVQKAIGLANLNSRFFNLSKTVRLGLQISVLGVGAALVLQSELTPGGMIAASIILARALSPIERSITAWRAYVSFRTAKKRLAAMYRSVDSADQDFDLPRPEGRLQVEAVRYLVPAAVPLPILKNVTLAAAPGEMVGVIGPSGSGKSTLCRIIVGALRQDGGSVRLDGAEISAWDPEKLGVHIGYLAQDVELFSGTVAENIARMRDASSEEIVAAAKLIGAHDMILKLPDGYDTDVGPNGSALSGGQRQRVGLARAVFGNPALLILDEPNSNMDGDGELALLRALGELKKHGTTILLVAHQPTLLRVADKVLVLKEGLVERFGPRDEILKSLVKKMPSPAANADRNGPAPAVRAATGGRSDE